MDTNWRVLHSPARAIGMVLVALLVGQMAGGAGLGEEAADAHCAQRRAPAHHTLRRRTCAGFDQDVVVVGQLTAQCGRSRRM